MSPFVFFVLQFAVLAYGFVGGVFLAFSDFIMRSLAHTRGVGGAEAMQIINREVFRWVFMALFLGMAGLSLLIVVYGAIYLTGVPASLMIAAGLVYLIGCFAVTVFFNVPLNEALAQMDVESDGTKAFWTGTYLPRWTAWNTVRTLACAISAAFLLSGLVWAAQPVA